MENNEAPRESRWQWLKRTLQTGGPGQCVFAINNGCNARCDFCNFALDKLPKKKWKFVTLQGARDAIDILLKNFVPYLIVTGGEPTLHLNLYDIISYARERGMSVLLVTNGSTLLPERCRNLQEAGVSNVIVSIDAPTAQAHENNRGLPKVCEKIRGATRVFKELGIQVTASVTMSRLVSNYWALVEFLKALGFDHVTFSYSLTELKSSFLGYAPSGLVSFTPSELVHEFDKVKELKKWFQVLNPTASLEDMQRFAKCEPQWFECLGGYRYFYLDWDLMVWRCHYWHKPICSIYDLDESKYIRDGCTACMIDCFRDSSVMQHIAVSVSDAVREARRRNLLGAARHLLTRRNLQSLKSVLENRKWIKNL